MVVKNLSQTNWHVFVAVMGKTILKITNLFGIFEAALSLAWHNFSVLYRKSSDYVDVDVSKLCGFISLHPV